jgi:hypothetical protein
MVDDVTQVPITTLKEITRAVREFTSDSVRRYPHQPLPADEVCNELRPELVQLAVLFMQHPGFEEARQAFLSAGDTDQLLVGVSGLAGQFALSAMFAQDAISAMRHPDRRCHTTTLRDELEPFTGSRHEAAHLVEELLDAVVVALRCDCRFAGIPLRDFELLLADVHVNAERRLFNRLDGTVHLDDVDRIDGVEP